MLANTLIPTGMYNLLTGVFPMMILFSIVVIVLRVITNVYSHSKFDFYHDLKALVYVLYCFVLFVLVTTNDFSSYSNNFIPFREIFRYKNIHDPLFIWNVQGNIILFMPFGFIIADVINLKSGKHNIWLTMLVSTITSLSIEIIQMFIGRSFDIDDIILKLFGAIIGYLVFRFFYWLFNHLIKNKLVKKICFTLLVIIVCIIIFIVFGMR